MYVITNSGELFSNEPTNCLIDEAGFNQAKWKISIYYNYETDGNKLFIFYYVDDCVYWYTYKEPEE